MNFPELFKLRPLAEYQVSRSHVFPSSGSMEWFVHRNRARLVKAGALVKLTGRSLVPSASARAFSSSYSAL